MPAVLPKWELNADFARLLASFERVIPLKNASNLTDKEMASRLLFMSGGTIGELSQLLNQASIWAIKQKTEQINFIALERCGYVRPADRKSIIARI